MKVLLRKIFHKAGFTVSRTSSHAALADNLLARRTPLQYGGYGFKDHEVDFFNYFIDKRETVDLVNSHSQLGQDLWVAFLLRAFDRKRTGAGGYFVEFGALDGKSHSNTYFLEKEFGWKGVLAEPVPHNFLACTQNRGCRVDNRCVWRVSGETLKFSIVDGMNALSTLSGFEDSDSHRYARATRTRTINVSTVSLNDLLASHDAPSIIDYLSVDTEGSEFEILSSFSFDSYCLKVISVEHNYGRHRASLRRLLGKNGFFKLNRSVDYFDDLYLNTLFFSPETFR